MDISLSYRSVSPNSSPSYKSTWLRASPRAGCVSWLDDFVHAISQPLPSGHSLLLKFLPQVKVDVPNLKMVVFPVRKLLVYHVGYPWNIPANSMVSIIWRVGTSSLDRSPCLIVCLGANTRMNMEIHEFPQVRDLHIIGVP